MTPVIRITLLLILALGLIFAWSAAFAEIGDDLPPAKPRMTLMAGDGGCAALIYVENRVGVYNAIETLHTPWGDVLVRYVTVGEHNYLNRDSDDRAVVQELPFGLSAEPMAQDIPDGMFGEICLREYSGA